MTTKNPFITRGLGMIDVVVPGSRLASLSAASRFALELVVLAIAAGATFWLSATTAGMGNHRAAEYALLVVLLFLSVRLLCAFCHFAWRRDPRGGQRWAPVIGLVSGCAAGLCLLLPGLIVVRVTGDVLMQRMPRLFGEPPNLWVVSGVVSIVGWIVAAFLIRDAADRVDTTT